MRRLLLCTLLTLSGCEPPKYQPPPTPAPSPTPVPTPTPTPTIPRKTLDVVQLFNGISLFTKFETPQSERPASFERNEPGSYRIEVTFTAKLPHPSRTLEELVENDPKLPEVLAKMPQLAESARVSPYFDTLYKNKIEQVRDRLNRLDLILSRHNFYDCETILELQDAQTGRKALLMQGDMDLNTDGSDGDRNFPVDATSPTFQPQTSYRWTKQTQRPNPLLTTYESKLAALKQELSMKSLPLERNRELKRSIDETNRVINELKTRSFLISGADPSIVVPGFMLNDKNNGFSPAIGDYAAVIYDGKVYPAIVGDAGPSSKIGEASARICKEINPKTSAINRAISNIKVTYLIFPGTAEKPGPPDLAHWRQKCQEFFNEIGGTVSELHTWEDIVSPWPTPTPSPTPTPTATPAPAEIPSPTASPEASPGGSPPASTASPSAAPSATPSPSASATPSASPSPEAPNVSPSPRAHPENSSSPPPQ
ncbi:MAG TPA: glycoside hydrolase family 75 protein [Terrimicrobiaceae bacterium]